MKTNLSIKELKELLPHGSYKVISKNTGLSYPTVDNFFNERYNSRIATRIAIIKETKKILQSLEI